MTRITRLTLPLLIVSVIGFIDAAWLTIQHLTGGPVPCLVSGCETVTTSQYATIGPIPIAALGAVYYVTLALVSIAIMNQQRGDWLQRISLVPITGFLFSLYLVYLQAFVIEAYCLYCLVSAATSTVLFLIGVWIYTQRNRYGQPA
jgi:uncharacterized membrane protein